MYPYINQSNYNPSAACGHCHFNLSGKNTTYMVMYKTMLIIIILDQFARRFTNNTYFGYKYSYVNLHNYHINSHF